MNEIELVAVVDEWADSMSNEDVAAGDVVEWYLPPELTDRELRIVEVEMARRYPGAEVMAARRTNSCTWYHDWSARRLGVVG